MLPLALFDSTVQFPSFLHHVPHRRRYFRTEDAAFLGVSNTVWGKQFMQFIVYLFMYKLKMYLFGIHLNIHLKKKVKPPKQTNTKTSHEVLQGYTFLLNHNVQLS